MPVPEKVPGRNGGTLVRHPEGSNGGTRRGPDLTPRKVAQAMILKALSDEGVVVVNRGRPTRTKNLSDRQERKARHAAVHNAATMIQNVFEDGARQPNVD